MPGIVEGILNPYNATAQYKENISDMIDAIDRREVPFLNMLGWPLEGSATQGVNSLKYPCTQSVHQWISDGLIPNTSKLAAAYVVGVNVLTVTTGEGVYFLPDDIVMATSGANTSTWRVLTVTGDTLAVAPVAGEAAHIATTDLYTMGRPAIRGEQFATTGRVTIQTTDVNYTQILGPGKEGIVAISGTEQATGAYGITDRMAYERAKVLTQLAIKLEQAAMYGERFQQTTNDQPASRFGGFFYFVHRLSAVAGAANGSTVIDCGGSAFGSAETQLQNVLDNIWSAGGNPSVALMNLFNRRQFNSFLVPFVRTERTENRYGVVGDTYVYSHGDLQIALSKWIARQHIFCMSPEYIGIGPLNSNGVDRSFKTYELPKDGDYDREAIVGEFTMEVRNRSAAHGILLNLAIG
jgi:hypothetical protein